MGHKSDRKVRKKRRDREARKAMGEEKLAMLEALKARRKANLKLERVDNASLHAGEPMYYYCRMCGAEMKLHEEHDPPAPSFCDDCHALREQGWSEADLAFTNTVEPCADCKGEGKREYPGFGKRTCQACAGRGKIILEPAAA